MNGIYWSGGVLEWPSLLLAFGLCLLDFMDKPSYIAPNQKLKQRPSRLDKKKQKEITFSRRTCTNSTPKKLNLSRIAIQGKFAHVFLSVCVWIPSCRHSNTTEALIMSAGNYTARVSTQVIKNLECRGTLQFLLSRYLLPSTAMMRPRRRLDRALRAPLCLRN